MKKIYLFTLMCLLPLTATPALACGGEDEEACGDSAFSEAVDETPGAADKLEEMKTCKLGEESPGCSVLFENPKEAFKVPRGEVRMMEKRHILKNFQRCSHIKNDTKYQECMDAE